MIRLLHVVGARPNFVKAAPVLRALGHRSGTTQFLVHTGQHYDAQMSGSFFAELGLPVPDANLGVGSGSHAAQTGRIMLEFEPVLERLSPSWVVVYGDVNSTLACALVAAKSGVAVAHVEAGLRSRDRHMPEELNRQLTDQLADSCFTPSRDADANLRAEGIPSSRIHFVGNVMVDSLLHLRDRARARQAPEAHGLAGQPYAFVTLHRPSNVDDRATLEELLAGLDQVAATLPVVFPLHPRTRQKVHEFGLQGLTTRLRLLEPLGYLDSLSLVERATLVLTDSGGLQEETTVLGVPCLTARPTTERPITVSEGTNRVIASTCRAVTEAVRETLQARQNGGYRPGRPEGWDGHAAERIADALLAVRGDR